MIKVTFRDGSYRIQCSPQFWGGLTIRQRRASLYHELAHIWRGDLLRLQEEKLDYLAWNVSSDAMINRQLPDIPPGAVSFSKTVEKLGVVPNSMAIYQKVVELGKDLSKMDIWIDGPKPQPVEDFDPSSLKEEEIWPLPPHLREWVKERWEWSTDQERQEEGEGEEYQGDLDSSSDSIDVIDHAKERGQMAEAFGKDGEAPEWASEKDGIRKGGTSEGQSEWSPREKKIMKIHVSLRNFAERHRRNRVFSRSWRRNGRTDLIRGSVLDPVPCVHVYLDVSGSTYSEWEELTSLARGLGKYARTFVFDTKVQEWDLVSPLSGIGGGTQWKCIKDHIITSGTKAVIVVTDGGFADDVDIPQGVDVIFVITPGGTVPPGVNAIEWPKGDKR